MTTELPGQLKLDPFTGKVSKVSSKATERPNRERQANLLDWAEDQEAWQRWLEAQDDYPMQEVWVIYSGVPKEEV